MSITVLSPVDVEVKEKDIQNAFEKNLGVLDEGLEFIASEVVIGTGRIDTLAYDSVNARPVFIEYKRPGAFGRDALIQLMDYLSWFARDENRMAVLEKILKQHKPGISEINAEISLICVVADIEDRVRNAIYAIANDVKVFTFLTARDTANNVIVIPKLEIDNTDIERGIPGAASESELLSRHLHLQALFKDLKVCLEQDGSTSYPTGKSFRFKKRRVFGKILFRKRYIQLELRVGKGAVNDPDFTYWRAGESSWGYTHLYPDASIPEKTKNWIARARAFVDQASTDNEVDQEAGVEA